MNAAHSISEILTYPMMIVHSKTNNNEQQLVTCKPCIIQTEQGEIAITINGNDSPATVKIKVFMALYGIIDIKMRMLRIPELKRIMGFPSDYVLVGTQADQKKFIGNAVEVNMARVLCEALCARLIKGNIQPKKRAA